MPFANLPGVIGMPLIIPQGGKPEIIETELLINPSFFNYYQPEQYASQIFEYSDISSKLTYDSKLSIAVAPTLSSSLRKFNISKIVVQNSMYGGNIVVFLYTSNPYSAANFDSFPLKYKFNIKLVIENNI